MRRVACCTLIAVAVSAATPARAHIAEVTVQLTTTEEVPPPTGTSVDAGGTAMIELSHDSTIAYEVTVDGLTGPARFGHIHEAAQGLTGNPVFTLTKVSDTTFLGETGPLTQAQVETLFAGGFYVNVHTDANPGGEIRAQLQGVERVTGRCSCLALRRGRFLKCVRDKIRNLQKTKRMSTEAKALGKAAKASSCGLTETKKPIACCLPMNGVGEVVSGTLCALVKKDTRCTALGGTSVQGQSCLPTNPCFLPAFPSGAFLDLPRTPRTQAPTARARHATPKASPSRP